MGNYAWICCLVALLAVFYPVEGDSRGIPITALSPRVLLAETTTPTCTNIFGPICGGCKTLWTCLGEDKPYKTHSCEKSYPGLPYCVNGACSSSPDPTDAQCSAATDITCTGIGYFPNPSNCTQYYLCAGANGASMAYECPIGYVYNSLANGCKRRTLPSDCSTINCAANPDRYVAYPADPGYFALCLVTEGVSTPIMFKCPDPVNQKFVASQNKCVFQCKSEGRIPDVNDCSSYYECYRSGLTFVPSHQKCLNGFIFSTTTKNCVSGKCDKVAVATDPEANANKGTETKRT